MICDQMCSYLLAISWYFGGQLSVFGGISGLLHLVTDALLWRCNCEATRGQLKATPKVIRGKLCIWQICGLPKLIYNPLTSQPCHLRHPSILTYSLKLHAPYICPQSSRGAQNRIPLILQISKILQISLSWGVRETG